MLTVPGTLKSRMIQYLESKEESHGVFECDLRAVEIVAYGPGVGTDHNACRAHGFIEVRESPY